MQDDEEDEARFDDNPELPAIMVSRLTYSRDYCDDIIAMASQGLFRESWAYHCGTTDEGLELWSVEHPEFKEAMRMAYSAALAYHSELLNQMMKRGHKNTATQLKLMQARFPEIFVEGHTTSFAFERRMRSGVAGAAKPVSDMTNAELQREAMQKLRDIQQRMAERNSTES